MYCVAMQNTAGRLRSRLLGNLRNYLPSKSLIEEKVPILFFFCLFLVFSYDGCRSPAERRVRAENLEEKMSQSELEAQQLVQQVQGTLCSVW